MTKWADFVVSAIKKGSGLANISHVQIHEDLEHGFGSPELIDKYQLFQKYKKVSHLLQFIKKMKMSGQLENSLELMLKMVKHTSEPMITKLTVTILVICQR